MSIVKFELNETQLALQLRSTLEQADSCYTKEYLPFAQANAKLSDDAFVDTLERQFAAKLLYVAWQGSLRERKHMKLLFQSSERKK